MSVTPYPTLRFKLTMPQVLKLQFLPAVPGFNASQVETQLANKVNRPGDTMTGFLTLNADPTAALHAATKQYVDTHGGGAPTDAQFIVSAVSPGLTAERVLTDTATVTWDFGTAGQAKATAVGGGGRERLTTARTYFVNNATGSDSNNGLAAGTPFKTIQKAWDVVSLTLDLNGFSVTIQLADGDYWGSGTSTAAPGPYNVQGNAGPPGMSGIANLKIQGNAANPSAVKLWSTQGAFSFGQGVSDRDLQLYIKDLYITSSSGNGIAVSGATILFENLDFGQCGGVHMTAVHGGVIVAAPNSSYRISGGASQHVACQSTSLMIIEGNTVTFSNNPAFGTFVDAFGGQVWAGGMTFVNGGTVTGKRFNTEKQGLISLHGPSIPAPPTHYTYFPGTLPGTIKSGGVYHYGDREVLFGPRTYFVSPTGNNASDGLNALTPFATLQFAYDVVQQLDFNGNTVTIQLANGTYVGPLITKAWIGGGQLTIQGDTTTPGNVVVTENVAAGACFAVLGSTLSGPIVLSGLALAPSTGKSHVFNIGNGTIYIQSVVFTATASNVPNAAITCGNVGSLVVLQGTCWINAPLNIFANSDVMGMIQVNGQILLLSSVVITNWVVCTNSSTQSWGIPPGGAASIGGSAPAAGTGGGFIQTNGFVNTANRVNSLFPTNVGFVTPAVAPPGAIA